MWLHDLFRPNLGKLAERQDVSGLIAALSHRDPIVQRQASTILRSMGRISVPLLLDTLQHGNAELQQRVSAVLKEIPNLPVETLITALGDDTGHTFPGVATLIATMGDQVVLPLMGALNSEYEEIRKGAIVALGMMGEPARPQLLAALMHPSYRIRYGAALALDRTGWVPQDEREKFRYLFATGQWSELVKKRKAVVLPLLAALEDSHYAVRRDVALALGSIGDLRAIDPLRRLLITDPEETVRAGAAEALGLLVDDQAIPALRAAINDHAHSVRMAAAQALARINWVPDDEQEQLTLLVATEQWSQLIRHGPAAIPVLITALGDEYYGIRTGSAEALWRIGDPAVKSLIRALHDQNPAIRAGSTGVLMRLGAFPREQSAPTYIEQIRPNITPPLHIRREVYPDISWTEDISASGLTPTPCEPDPVEDDLALLLSPTGTQSPEEMMTAEPAVGGSIEFTRDIEDGPSLPLSDDLEDADQILAGLDDSLPPIDLSSLQSTTMTIEAPPFWDLPVEDDLATPEPLSSWLDSDDLIIPQMDDGTPSITPSSVLPVVGGPGLETAGSMDNEASGWAPVQESAFLSLMETLQRNSPDDEERSQLISSYLADQHGVLSSDQPSVIVSAVGPGLSAEDDAVRMVAAEVLGQIGIESVPLLLKALQDPYYQVRVTAADALGQIRDQRALSPLVNLLIEDEDEEVRSQAAHALGELRNPATTEVLVRALHDQYPVVRGAAARALGMIGNRQGIGPLVALFESGDRATAEDVIWALRTLGADQDLAMQASDTADERRQKDAKMLLARLHEEETTLSPLPPRQFHAVLSGEVSPIHEITIPQEGPPPIEVTQLNPTPRSVPPLPEPIDESGGLESGTVPSEDPDFVLLIEASVHEEARVRKKVAHALAKSHDPRAGDLLRTLLTDEDEDVRASASASLGLLGDQAAVPDLITALEDQSDEVVMRAARSLGEIQDPAAAAPLIQLLDADDYGVRQVAGEALTALGSGATEALVEALNDPEKEIRAGSAESLAAAGWTPTDTVQEVGYLIAEERWSEIGRFGEDALPPLAQFINDPDPEIRLGVVSALAKIGGPSAAVLLEHAAADSSYLVRKRAGLLLREESATEQSEQPEQLELEEPVPEIQEEE
ncbi:HEAT repeat domain-containing protein [Methanosphaerula palustris]|uniref:HEAT domain containing protein n=1 Tax=Methanosphaerula palustris (strain ATCC BAA-1556 / DSM 19958 / E1-9c) TaxID=521011 RepID=B8GFW2_METPE|nr:HEAT repeat domain-containing protein [Methanosphaerula palustris]ACL17995.1 HEAT domain containing protein [Methanosphaerula palustris E1-9c]